LRHVDPTDSHQSRKQILVPGDVLLSTTGSIGRTAIAKPVSREPPIFASHSTVVLRLRQHSPILDPVVLFMYLRSPFFQSLLRTVEARTVTPHVSVADVRSLPVIVPTPDEQRRLIELFEAQARLGQQIEELKRTNDQLSVQEWSRLGLVDVEEKK
jgi:restriction endonuclease S subunit